MSAVTTSMFADVPIDYQKIEEAREDSRIENLDKIRIPLGHVQKAIVLSAKNEFEKEVRDRPAPKMDSEDLQSIRDYYEYGLLWPSFAERYYGDGDGEWCGAYVGFCHSNIGDYLFKHQSVNLYVKDAVRTKRMASCYRWWRYKNKYDLEVSPSEMRPGDIAVVGEHPKGHVWGRHITICQSAQETTFDTYEGNGIGKVPSGRQEEGNVTNRRSKKEIQFVVRLKPKAFVTPDHIEIEDRSRK